jgi:hypothetical protein
MGRGTLLMVGILLLGRAWGADAVRIEEVDYALAAIDGPGAALYRITAPAYAAEVCADGTLRLRRGAIELASGLYLALGGKAVALAPIARDGDLVQLREKASAANAKAADPLDQLLDEGGAPTATADLLKEESAKLMANAPGLDLRFLPDRIELIPAHLGKAKATKPNQQVAAWELAGPLADSAVGIRNLISGEEEALPAHLACSPHEFSEGGWLGHYWPEVAITYTDGTQVEITGIQGVDHFAEPGRGPAALRSRRGFWSVKDASVQCKKVVLHIVPPLAATVIEAAPYVTLRPDRSRGLFYEDEPVRYHLEGLPDACAPGTWRLDWTVVDHRAQPVATGGQDLILADGKFAPDEFTVTTADQMGFFRLRVQIQRPGGHSARRVQYVDCSRLRPEHPELRELDGTNNPGLDWLWENILGMRGVRDAPPDFAAMWKTYRQPNGDYRWDEALLGLKANLEFSRQRGTVRGVCLFLGANSSPPAAAMVEPGEEPNVDAALGRKPEGDDLAELGLGETAGDRAKAAAATSAATAAVLERERLRFLRELIEHTRALGIDAWEPVNEPNLEMGPDGYAQRLLQPQYPVVKTADPKACFLAGSICGIDGDDKLGYIRWLYEHGARKYFDGISLHPYTGTGFQEIYRAKLRDWRELMREFGDGQAPLWITEGAWHRGWGFNDYLYDRHHAFRESSARNAVNLILNSEAMTIPRWRNYVFYAVEHGYNDFYLVRNGSLTPAAVSLQVMNECLRDSRFVQETALPGPGGRYLQLYRDGTRTVAVAFTADEPAELSLLTDARAVVVTEMMGQRRAVAPQGGRFQVAISGDPVYLAVGPAETIRPDYAGLRVQPNLALTTLGATATASAAQTPFLPPVAIAGDWTTYGTGIALGNWRLGWREPDAGQDQYPDWFAVHLPQPVPVASVRVVLDYGAWEITPRDYEVQAFVDGAWKTVDQVQGNRWRSVFDHHLDNVRTDHVRLVINKVNSCLFEYQAPFVRVSCLRAVEVYAAPGAPAAAFFVPELPRSRILPPGKVQRLDFTLRNVRAEALEGEVDLTLPPGLTADRRGAAIRLEPEAEATVAFDVTIDPQAADGLYTVVAGFYRQGKLASTDYACRVLCGKRPEPPTSR